MSSNIQSSQRANHRVLVKKIEEVAPTHFQIQLEAPLLSASARPGQFVHVATTPNPNDWTFDPLLRRAFSIMNVGADGIDLLFRVEGRGTQALARAREGDEIDMIGPLGKPFDISSFEVTNESEYPTSSAEEMFHVKQKATSAIVVGGGVGVPPLVYLSHALKSMNVDVHAIIGARGSDEIIGWQELSESCAQVLVTTDDGSRGHHGRVTELLTPLIEKLLAESGKKPIVYSCGPLPMLRATAQVCAAAQVRCQVSMEENMPCGIGVCNGCVVRTRQPFAEDNGSNDTVATLDINEVLGNEWSPYRAYRRVCVEGPACWADEIDWEHQG